MEMGNSYFIGAETTFNVIGPIVHLDRHHSEPVTNLFYEYLSFLKL
jgi:hypothetical protein